MNQHVGLLVVVAGAGLVLLGAGYQENLAVAANVFGWKGLQAFASVAEHPSEMLWTEGRIRLTQEARELRTGDVSLRATRPATEPLQR